MIKKIKKYLYKGYKLEYSQSEKLKDTILNEIKYICFLYLENDKRISEIENDVILDSYNYLHTEYCDLMDLKKNLKIQNYSSTFYEIGKTLDDITLSNHILDKKEKMLFIELTKDVNHLEDIISFCIGIISLIIKERKI